MNRHTLLSVVLAVSSLLFSTPLLAHDGEIQVTFDYDSEPDDPIGDGNTGTFTEADGNWNVTRNFDNGVSLSFSEDPGSEWWNLDFAAADEVELSAGQYLNAERYPFQDPGMPGIDISANGSGCGSGLTGEFLVTEVRFDWFGRPVRFSATFEQDCDPDPGSPNDLLTGSVSYSEGIVGPFFPSGGNVLVQTKRRFWEYTTGGVMVSEVPIMDAVIPNTDVSGTEYPRDLAFDGAGRIHLFNGTFDPVLTSFDAGSGNWQDNTTTDWKIVNNTTYGSVTAYGDSIFVADQLNNKEVIRFDAASGYSVERFPAPSGFNRYYIDLVMGLDGRLYALKNDEETVDIYFPPTMDFLGELPLAEDVRGIAVDTAGTIYGASSDNNLYRFTNAGAVDVMLNPTGVGSLHDIDVSRSGQIVATGPNDDVFVVTSTALASATTYPLPSATGVENPFITFVQTPASPLFAGGFETGNTSGWSAVTGEGAGFLDVTAGAANNGSFGLEVTVGGVCISPQDQVIGPSGSPVNGFFEGCDTLTATGVEVGGAATTFQAGSSITLENDVTIDSGIEFNAVIDQALISGFAYVEDDSPAAAKSYRARFDLKLDDMTLADTDTFDVLVGQAGNSDDQFRVVIKRNAAPVENRLLLAAREDGGGTVVTPLAEELPLPAGFNQIEIYWHTTPGGGQLLVSLNGAAFVGLSALDNDLGKVDRVRLGVVAGSVGSSSGNIDIDDFYSWQ